ncbi:MAG: reverse gyrase [Sulfolobales archaeon]|nr:reverse gyrase [Sulfolobales archaeon]MDW8010154.1 reverse gyrase [Sulfolobales archaeon]
MLVFRHVCLDGVGECSDASLLGGRVIFDAVDGLLEDFSVFFREVAGFSMWALQRSWARRMLAGESFALVAPTGVGKSTLLQVFSLYRALGGDPVLYVVPTRSLVSQVVGRLRSLGGGLGVAVVGGLGSAGPGVYVSTHMSLFRSREALKSSSLGVVIVDDFDALLKKSSLLDAVLLSLGFTAEDLESARRLVKLRREAAALKHSDPGRYEEVSAAIEELEAGLSSRVGSRRVGQLLVASATGRGRGERVKVLRELLGFEVGGIVDYLRNIREFSAHVEGVELAQLLEVLGRGTLVFVSRDVGREGARRLAEELGRAGVRVAVAHTASAIEKLRRGDVDVLVGVATYYGVLTRGIDEPSLIKSSVFVGIPKFTVPLDTYLSRTTNILTSYRALSAQLRRDPEAAELYEKLLKTPPPKLRGVDLYLRELQQPPGPLLEELVNYAVKLRNLVKKAVESELPSAGHLVLGNAVARSTDRGIVVEIPDIYTYVQGSGRTSRLLGGRMTLGISILLYESEVLFEIFLRRLRNFFESNFKPLRHDELLEALKEASESRSAPLGQDSAISRIVPTLVVVESPTKARTIARIFGGGGRRYTGGVVAYEAVVSVGQVHYVATIVPTLGHLFDLAVDTGIYGVRVSRDGAVEPVYTVLRRCRSCGHQFTDEVDSCPRCGSLRVRSSDRTVKVLRKLARESSLVVVATDADEEGEKISYDVYVTLRPYNENIKRAEFHEITRHGVVSGLSSMRDVNVELVKSQVVRRVDDRLVGFGISSILKELLGDANAGGGRVQTPVLSWVAERYGEYLRNASYVVSVELPRGELGVKLYAGSREEAEELRRELSSGIEVAPVAEEVETAYPKPPYTTDTALEELGRYLRLSPGDVMKILQDLYEAGFITYHRTPSTRVSSYGIELARTYLESLGIENLFSPRTWGSGGAHEAIRPTRPLEDIELESIQLGAPLSRKHYEAYKLVFRRFIASQMAPSKILFRVYSLRSSGREIATARLPVRVVEEGFTKVSRIELADLPDGPSVVKPKDVRVYRGSRTSLMTLSEVIRRMREEGIGRPSTYARAIENNRRHGYVVISRRRQHLVPTSKGIAALEAVGRVCPQLLTSQYTARLMRLVEKVGDEFPYDLAVVLPLSTLAEIEIRRSLSVKQPVGTCGESLGV